MTKTPPKAVVFDLGKVLLHFDYAIAAARFQRRSRLSLPEVQRVIDQSPLLLQLETNAISTRQFFDELCRRTGFDGSLEEFADIFCNVFTPIEPMIQLQQRLHERGVPTFIFSNTNFLQIDHIRKTFDFLGRFQGMVLSCEEGCMKPDERIYRTVEARSGLRGEDLLYLDDRWENVETGRRLGWRAIHHTSPDESIHQVRQHGLDANRILPAAPPTFRKTRP